MGNRFHRIAYGLAAVSLFAIASQAEAQRGRHAQGARQARPAQARSHGQNNRQVNRNNVSRNDRVNRNANVNRNYNRNGNRNYNRTANRNYNRNGNRNYNRNVNVNVNRNVNVHYWSGNRIYARPYGWPRGYGYVRRPIGYVMPRPFLSSSYYYNDWGTLGLMAPQANYRWVRYGPDLFLVNVLTGRVTDVRYSVFR